MVVAYGVAGQVNRSYRRVGVPLSDNRSLMCPAYLDRLDDDVEEDPGVSPDDFDLVGILMSKLISVPRAPRATQMVLQGGDSTASAKQQSTEMSTRAYTTLKIVRIDRSWDAWFRQKTRKSLTHNPAKSGIADLCRLHRCYLP